MPEAAIEQDSISYLHLHSINNMVKLEQPYIFSLLIFAFGIVSSFRFSLNYIKHTIFKSLFVFAQPVLFPSEVKNFLVKIVFSEAFFKHSYTVLVVRLFFKFQLSAILHEFFEFRGISPCELI